MKQKERLQRILFEDNHLLVFNKPAGLLVQGDKTNDTTLIDLVKEYIKVTYDKPGNVFCGLTHRIDRPVSGAVILAKTSKALSRVTQAFKNKEVEKTYLAICHGRPQLSSGNLENYLLKDAKKNKVRVYNSAKAKAKIAQTQYELIHHNNDKCLMKVFPKTGRSHQIRVHMSNLGIPILGDLKYGATKPLQDKSIALHCFQMSMIHPVTKEMISFRASLPNTSDWSYYTSLVDKI